MYYEKYYGSEKAAQIKGAFLGNKLKDKKLVRDLKDYANMEEYSRLVYQEGALVLDLLRQKIGDPKFLQILQRYYDEYQFKIATIKDFIGIVEEVTGQRWDDFFATHLYNQK
jgi:aminopeptidase N